MIKRLTIKVSKDPKVYAGQYLSLLNGFMQLHPRQLRVLISIAGLGKGRVNTQVRREIREELNFRTPDALNMVIRELKLKGVLLPDGKRGELKIIDTLLPQKLESLIFDFSEEDDKN